ncbi:MAG: YceD family protein [Hydrogenophaga sp.]
MQALTPTDPTSVWNPQSLDVRAFTQAGAVIIQDTPLADFDRLAVEALDGDWGHVRWRIQGEVRSALGDGKPTHWLHLTAQAALGLTCQRCLTCVVSPLSVDRWFRFVATETQAAAEDDGSEEDVLAWEPRPDVLLLIEDELLMALPLVPMHERCPTPIPMAQQDDPQEPKERPHPFAALAQLKKGR